MARQKSQKTIEKSERLLGLVRANPGLETREYWEILRQEDFWDEDWLELAVERAQLQDLRAHMGVITDEFGHRLVHNVRVRDPETGKASRYYVHEAAMDQDEFRAVVNDMLAKINRTCAEAVELVRRCKERYNTNIPLPQTIRDIAQEYEAELQASEANQEVA